MSSFSTKKPRVHFGYLFYNMRNHLCFMISMEKNDTWAIEYTPVGDSYEWEQEIFCPNWWTETHAAGHNIPMPDQLRKALVNAILRKFSALDGLGAGHEILRDAISSEVSQALNPKTQRHGAKSLPSLKLPKGDEARS